MYVSCDMERENSRFLLMLVCGAQVVGEDLSMTRLAEGNVIQLPLTRMLLGRCSRILALRGSLSVLLGRWSLLFLAGFRDAARTAMACA